MIKQFVQSIFDNPLYAFIGTILFFLVLYFTAAGFASGLKIILKKIGIGAEINVSNHKEIPVSVEIKRSMISIIMFGLLTIPIQLLYKAGYIHIDMENPQPIWWEVLVLFLWNEIHFYFSHYLLHRKWFFKKVHYMHHQTFIPTPFSTYSFHWAEALLLGSVIYIPLFIHPFHLYSMLSLPIISIIINVFGHWNYDVFPKLNYSENILKFSYRHSMHHQKIKGNFGFFLPFIDILMKSKINPDSYRDKK